MSIHEQCGLLFLDPFEENQLALLAFLAGLSLSEWSLFYRDNKQGYEMIRLVSYIWSVVKVSIS